MFITETSANNRLNLCTGQYKPSESQSGLSVSELIINYQMGHCTILSMETFDEEEVGVQMTEEMDGGDFAD